MQLWQVVLLGLIEGLTEFIPVSSTGHLLLAGHFLNFQSPGKTFEVLIQLGAILAILSVYFTKLWHLLIVALSSTTIGKVLGADRGHAQAENARARRFLIAVLVAFLPAAAIGAGAHGFIKRVLFESPALICSTLIIGGIVLLAVDRLRIQPRYDDAMDFPIPMAFVIGLAQCLALVPGVSRSAASIVSALLLRADKRSATEFSFFLAMPTMAGAFAFDLYKNYAQLAPQDITSIALGFIVAFVAAVLVVRYLLDFVSRHGFAPFAYWRILVGAAGLVGLAVLG